MATSVAAEPVHSTSRQDAGMVDPPWLITNTLMVTSTDPGIVDALNVLPGATKERVSNFVLPTLSLHEHVLEKTRAKVWSGETPSITPSRSPAKPYFGALVITKTDRGDTQEAS